MSPDPPAPAPPPPSASWFRRRARPCPTGRTWLCTSLTLLALALLAARLLHPWLALSDPAPQARYLVVEGWVPDPVFHEVIAWTDEHPTTRVFCTGIPLEQGSYLMQWKTFAEVAAHTLARLGLEPQLICPVPAVDAKTERTRAMATALKAVLDREPIPDTGRQINLLTLGTHARRSRAIFQEVLGPQWHVGVLSVPPLSYDPLHWYRHSEGAKSVITELCALALMAAGGN